MIIEQLRKDFEKVLEKLGIPIEKLVFEHPAQLEHGDYSTNIALRTKKAGYPTAWDLANKIVNSLRSEGMPDYIVKIEVAGPGFINVWLKNDLFIKQIDQVLKDKNKYGWEKANKARSVMVEFAHPNTHKQFHIGHLRNICLGESVSRLLEAGGMKVVRSNYQGDVGLHVAKCLWAVQRKRKAPRSLDDRIKFLAKAYIQGSQAYEKNEKAKKEIKALNVQIYSMDKKIKELWQQTRGWSLDYFERIYERLGTKYDRFYFESQVADPGKEIALEAKKKGILVESEGALIFPGEQQGLHNRVFITQADLPTYEAKDLGLAKRQFADYQLTKIIHVVGPEQQGYFKVLFKALEKIIPLTKGKEFHLVYGWVRLKEGKISSRTGQVVLGEWLLDEAKKRLSKNFKMTQSVAEQVAIGAVKYSLLKFGSITEIVFDIDESISLEGDSGPYLQYTYARCQSVLSKAGEPGKEIATEGLELSNEEMVLLRTLYRFPEVVADAGRNYSPNLICNFLFDLAQKYNLFYNKQTILKAEPIELRAFRLRLTAVVSQVIKNGLYLLGIEAPEKM